MRRVILATMSVAILGLAGVLLAQQDYPNVAAPEVVLDNEHVVVQRIEFQPGEWSGEHSHPGNQLVVILDDIEMLYKSEAGEEGRNHKSGDVFWVDPVTHDHKSVSEGVGLLISLK